MTYGLGLFTFTNNTIMKKYNARSIYPPIEVKAPPAPTPARGTPRGTVSLTTWSPRLSQVGKPCSDLRRRVRVRVRVQSLEGGQSASSLPAVNEIIENRLNFVITIKFFELLGKLLTSGEGLNDGVPLLNWPMLGFASRLGSCTLT